jgi:hypothetical protein
MDVKDLDGLRRENAETSKRLQLTSKPTGYLVERLAEKERETSEMAALNKKLEVLLRHVIHHY